MTATRPALSPSTGLPAALADLAHRSLVSEYATLTREGRPVTWAVTPYLGEDGSTVDVSTGLTYPAKAERARRDPRVSLLFSSPTGTGLEHPDVVLVQGLATVRDADLQAGLDRYLREPAQDAAAAIAGFRASPSAAWTGTSRGSGCRSRRCAR